MDDSLQKVRQFNRAVTQRIGVLTDNYLGRGRPLGESRLAFEVGRDGADVRELRKRLSLDSGYLSRLLRSLEAQGLLATKPAPDDARVRRVSLTRKGLRELALLDQRSQALAQSLLAPLGATQRERLVTAMSEVERFLSASAVSISPADPAGSEIRACIASYLRELDARFENGFEAARGPSADPDEFVPPRGVMLLARLDGEAVGCGGIKTIGTGIGEIKRMWVAPSARGLGIAQRLLDALERHAAELGFRRVRLDTNRTLVEARALYLRNGYREIAAYNENPYADHWLEKSLQGSRRGTARF